MFIMKIFFPQGRVLKIQIPNRWPLGSKPPSDHNLNKSELVCLLMAIVRNE